MNNPICGIHILLTLIVAMCLRIVPLPISIAVFNPDWVLLVLIYWSLAIPERVGIGYAWMFGILTDVLMGRSFGQSALAYSLVIYLCLVFHRQVRQFTQIQQSLFVLGYLLILQLLLFWFENLKSSAHFSGSFWLPVISGTLCWTIVYRIMRFIRQW